MQKSRLLYILVFVMTLALITTAMAGAAAAGRGNSNTNRNAPVDSVRATFPGNGNAWGRIAKELDTDLSPGSVVRIVHQLKEGLVPEEPQETEEDDEEETPPEAPESINATIVDFLTDDDGNFTGQVIILVPGTNEEADQEYIIDVDEQTLTALQSGTEFYVVVTEDGELEIELITEEPAEEDESDDEASEDDDEPEGEAEQDEPVDETDEVQEDEEESDS